MRQLLAVLSGFLISASLFADDGPLAKMRSPIGTVLERGQTWLTPQLYDGIPADVQLTTLPGARGIVDVREGDARLVMGGNLPEFSKTPVLESVVTMRRPGQGTDLEFTLERGRVLIENHKEAGQIRVRARIRDKHLDFELADKNSLVALELFSLWPEGESFYKKPKPGHEPLGELIFLVMEGKAEVEFNKTKHPLTAPVMYRFDSRRNIEGPLQLKKAPNWVKPSEDQPDKVKVLQTAVEKLRRLIADKGVLAGINAARESKEISMRIVAAYSGVALDMPSAGIAALKDAKAKEVRAAGAKALRHYIGRGTREDVQLYETLVAEKMKSGQAGIVMELLHGMSSDARQRPETYDTLITYLQNEQLAIRELAALNLYRLVPQGTQIAFDAGAPSEQRARAQEAWRKLIPEGQMPRQIAD